MNESMLNSNLYDFQNFISFKTSLQIELKKNITHKYIASVIYLKYERWYEMQLTLDFDLWISNPNLCQVDWKHVY